MYVLLSNGLVVRYQDKNHEMLPDVLEFRLASDMRKGKWLGKILQVATWGRYKANENSIDELDTLKQITATEDKLFLLDERGNLYVHDMNSNSEKNSRRAQAIKDKDKCKDNDNVIIEYHKIESFYQQVENGQKSADVLYGRSPCDFNRRSL